jgi:hypothetical protein
MERSRIFSYGSNIRALASFAALKHYLDDGSFASR